MTDTTTHLICAHCGGDNTVSSYLPPDGTLEIFQLTDIWFTCKHCKESYRMLGQGPADLSKCMVCEAQATHGGRDFVQIPNEITGVMESYPIGRPRSGCPLHPIKPPQIYTLGDFRLA